jgi:hypothetical protein
LIVRLLDPLPEVMGIVDEEEVAPAASVRVNEKYGSVVLIVIPVAVNEPVLLLAIVTVPRLSCVPVPVGVVPYQ